MSLPLTPHTEASEKGEIQSTNVYLIRHGETEWNINRRFQGQLDIALNANGRKQAAAVARWLAAQQHDIQAIYTSDLSRAQETAKIIGAALDLEVTLTPELRELHCGEWQGLSVDEVEAHYPGQLKLWHESADTFILPGGESIPIVQRRVYDLFRRVVAGHGGETIVLVSHGAALSALIAAIFSWDIAETWRTRRARMGNTAVTLLKVVGTGDAAEMMLFNSTVHLDAKTELETVLDSAARLSVEKEQAV